MEQIGFKDKTFESQEAFRLILQATSNPGKKIQFTNDYHSLENLNASSINIIFTLLDLDTNVFIQSAQESNISNFIKLHTGAPITKNKVESDFAVVTDGDLDFDSFHVGLDQYPDKATTLIIQIHSMSQGEDFVLSGPGIKNSNRITLSEFVYQANRVLNGAVGKEGVLVHPQHLGERAYQDLFDHPSYKPIVCVGDRDGPHGLGK